jgi:hypothetical protein
MDGGTVTGFLGELKILTATETTILFSAGDMNAEHIVGTLNRHSGAATIGSTTGGFQKNYSLTCKPAKPLF